MYNYRDLNLLVSVSDRDGRQFDNFSSVAIDWLLSDQSLASFEGEDIRMFDSVQAVGAKRDLRSECKIALCMIEIE